MTVSAASLVFNVSLLSGGLGRNGLSLIAGGTLYWVASDYVGAPVFQIVG